MCLHPHQSHFQQPSLLFLHTHTASLFYLVSQRDDEKGNLKPPNPHSWVGYVGDLQTKIDKHLPVACTGNDDGCPFYIPQDVKSQ